MTAARVYVPKVSYSCTLPLWDSLNSACRLTQDHFKWLLLPWVPEYVRFCVCPWRVESLFLTALWVSQMEVLWTSKSNILGHIFLLQDAWAVETDGGSEPLFLGATPTFAIILLYVGCPPGGCMGFYYTHILNPLYPCFCPSYLILTPLQL